LNVKLEMFMVYSDTYTHTYTSKRQHRRPKITCHTPDACTTPEQEDSAMTGSWSPVFGKHC